MPRREQGKASRYARKTRADEPAPTVLASDLGWSDIAVSGGRPAGQSDKPPFRVPTMAEIADLEPNGLTVASTFAGAGGSSTGWKIAGYQVLWANEFYAPAADSYVENHKTTVMDRRDIRDIDAADIVGACGRVPDVLDGSPPCQDFSMAGKRTRGWGQSRSHGDGTVQRSDDLFAQFTRLVKGLEPRAFVAENVKGLVSGAAKGQFKRIVSGLEACGYRVKARVLDAQWLGVPQHRQRVIIVGIRNDLGLEPAFPDPLPYRYSILDACPWLASFDGMRPGGGFSEECVPLNKPSPTFTVTDGHNQQRWQLRHHRGHNFTDGTRELTEPSPTINARSPSGDLRIENGPGKRFAHGRRTPVTEPVQSVTTQGTSGIRHGEMKLTDGTGARKLSIPEVKRLCSFPDDYVLLGSYGQQWARLGNSVPPLLMAAVARRLAPLLLTGS